MSQKEKVTLTLPSEVMDAVREEAEPRGYSKFIAEAVSYYIQERRRSALRERLIAGYQADAERDQALAEEWRHAEEEVWPEYSGTVEERSDTAALPARRHLDCGPRASCRLGAGQSPTRTHYPE